MHNRLLQNTKNVIVAMFTIYGLAVAAAPAPWGLISVSLLSFGGVLQVAWLYAANCSVEFEDRSALTALFLLSVVCLAAMFGSAAIQGSAALEAGGLLDVVGSVSVVLFVLIYLFFCMRLAKRLTGKNWASNAYFEVFISAFYWPLRSLSLRNKIAGIRTAALETNSVSF